MANRPALGGVASGLQTLWEQGVPSACTDAELLGRFAAARDEAAFTVLVGRHGPLVLGVCIRVLRDVHAAEDAAQATFLVLARKAGAVRNPERLSAWLHGVALRTANKARVTAARRRKRERDAGAAMDHFYERDPGAGELGAVIDEELGRLPEKYRVPVLLCDLEGHTVDDAASLVGCPRGTLGTRLTRARTMLKTRLDRRGLALGTGLSLAYLTNTPASAAWIKQTVEAATRFAGSAVTTTGSTAVAGLARQVLREMVLIRLRSVGAVLATLMVGTGVVLAWQANREGPNRPAGGRREPQVAAGEDAVRAEASRSLRTIALALFGYHNRAEQLPPPFLRSVEGKPLLSWRVAILPLLGESALYESFRLDEPWDSPHNKALLTRMPKVYQCLGLKDSPTLTYYQAFVGPGSVFEGPQGVSFEAVTDARSGTFLVAQAGEPVPWTKPDDLSFEPGKPLPRLDGPLKGGFLALMTDGSVRFVPADSPRATIEAAIVRNDGRALEPGDRPAGAR